MTHIDRPDYTDAPTFGSGVLLPKTTLTVKNGTTWYSPVWYTGAMGSLFWAAFLKANVDMSYVFTFYQDPGGRVPVTDVAYNKTTISTTSDSIPVVGPYLQLAVTNNTAGASTDTDVFVSSSQGSGAAGIGPALLGGGDRLLLPVAYSSFPAGSTTNFTPESFVPGRAVLSWYVSGGPVQWVIVGQTSETAQVGVMWDQYAGPGAGSDTRRIVLPNDDWVLRLTVQASAAVDATACVMTDRD